MSLLELSRETDSLLESGEDADSDAAIENHLRIIRTLRDIGCRSARDAQAGLREVARDDIGAPAMLRPEHIAVIKTVEEWLKTPV